MGTFPPIASVLLQLLHSCFLPTPAPCSQPVQAALSAAQIQEHALHADFTCKQQKAKLKVAKGGWISSKNFWAGRKLHCTCTALRCNQHSTALQPAHHCPSTALHCNLHGIAACTPLRCNLHTVATCTPLHCNLHSTALLLNPEEEQNKSFSPCMTKMPRHAYPAEPYCSPLPLINPHLISPSCSELRCGCCV